MKKQKLIIAIDGVSSSGKSTIASSLAKLLDYIYIDTGAMYRALTYKLLKNNIDINDPEQIDRILKNTVLEFKLVDGKNTLFLDSKPVGDEIRSLEVSDKVSDVAKIPEIRKFLVDIQRKTGKNGGVVMDGRDIGTVVFPGADLKFFITADIDERAKRRHKELEAKTGRKHDMEEIKSNLEKRDRIDSAREHSPLKKAGDAIVVNTSNMTKDEQLQYILGFIPEEEKESLKQKRT